MIPILGYGILLFYVLALTNGLKQYTKNSFVHFLSKHHKVFGMIAVTLAIVHFGLNIASGVTNPVGFITLLLLVFTMISGMLVKVLKSNQWLLIHRMMFPLVFLFIIIHIFTN